MLKTLRTVSVLAVLLSAFFIARPAAAEENGLLLGSIGYYDVLDHKDTAVDFRLDYRWNDSLLWFLKPYAGVEVTSDTSFYGSGGFYADLGFLPHWYLVPSMGVGLFLPGHGKQLDFPVEFRSQLEVDYEFDNKNRVGAGFSHTSNADLGHDNPGVETLFVSYGIPF